MKIRNYTRSDATAVLRLWNTAGAQTMGYAPQSAEGLDALLLRHPDFSEKHSFVLTDADGVRGFVSGVTGDALAQGRVRGYFSCLLLDPAADSDEDWWNMVYKWDDCPVLASLDLGDYGPDTTQSRSGSSQEYMSQFYVGMRGAWNSGTADNLAGGEEFWQKLTEGAVSTAAPEG